jgi:hypothetical protein
VVGVAAGDRIEGAKDDRTILSAEVSIGSHPQSFPTSV